MTKYPGESDEEMRKRHIQMVGSSTGMRVAKCRFPSQRPWCIVYNDNLDFGSTSLLFDLQRHES